MDRTLLTEIFNQARERIFGVSGTSAVAGCLTDPARAHLTRELEQLEQDLAVAIGLAELPTPARSEEKE